MSVLARALLVTSMIGVTGAAHADPSTDACSALKSARIHLVALIGATNRIARDNHNAQLHKASAKLDEVLAGMVNGQNANDAEKARAFEIPWEAFKKTRETKIIPAVYAGRNDDARAIALGIQAERIRKMSAVMGCK